MKITTTTLALLAAATLLPTAASADATAPTSASANRAEVSRSVDYGDLDLSNPEGVARLDQRIATAVRQACGRSQERDLHQLADVNRCRREALVSAAHGRELAMAGNERRTGVAMLSIKSRIKN